MEVTRPSTPEWARKLIAEDEKSAARMKKWSEELIGTFKETFAKPQKWPPSSTSHQNSATPSFVGFTRSLYSAPPPSACRTCRQQFPSRNALFVHLNATKHFLSIPKAKTSPQKPSPGTIPQATPRPLSRAMPLPRTLEPVQPTKISVTAKSSISSRTKGDLHHGDVQIQAVLVV
jgi:hypothetical protein